MRWLVGLVLGVVAVYAAVCVVLARAFTGSPPRSFTWPLRASPGDTGLAYEDVSFDASDRLRISGWWLPAGSTAVVMIPGGGLNRLNDNTRFAEMPTRNLKIAAALTSCGHSVLMYDPRATGGSDGSGSAFGSLETRDLVGAIDWLGERGFGPNDVAVIGWSMGGATAMFTLESRTFAGLIADSALGGFVVDDVVAYVARSLKVPRWLARAMTMAFMSGVFAAARSLWGMRLREQPADKLRANPIPTLVIHGRADRQVPVRVGEQIAAAAGAKLIGAHFLEGVDHLDAFDTNPDWYIATITDALDVMFAHRAVAAARDATT